MAKESSCFRLISDTRVEGSLESRTLVVLLHGYTLDRDSLDEVAGSIRTLPDADGSIDDIDDLRQADVLRPNLPLGLFSMARTSSIVAELLLAIDTAWAARVDTEPYRRIVFIGHSAGALFARKIYALACGENPAAPFEPGISEALADRGASNCDRPRDWAPFVDRVVLLAGMNRGWTISHHMGVGRAFSMQLGVAFGYLLSWIRQRAPFIFSVRRGSPFITQLRIQWLEMIRQAPAKGVGDAVTVQLLGTIDDLVSPDDNIDQVSGSGFRYIEVPASSHRNVVAMDDSDAGASRRLALARALGDDEAHAVLPSDEAPIEARPDVTDVIFVIHGIRDLGFWTQKIARRVRRLGADQSPARLFATETSTYGYFPMLSFLIPGARQKKVAWLMDRYTEARAKYPNATFHYVGHSHGTYLLAKALRDYPSVRFGRVVFAGSVVRRRFEWPRYMETRVDTVLNFVATADWVVAFFPKALESIRIQDLGGAGHDGFIEAKRRTDVLQPDRFVVGQHSAALQEVMWDSIAGFIVTGAFVPPAGPVFRDRQAAWVKYPALVAPVIWVAIAAALGSILYGILLIEAEWARTLGVVAYAAAVWTLLTKV